MPTAGACVSSSSTSKRSNPSTATRKATSRTTEYSKSSTDKKLPPNRTTTRSVKSASLRRSTISDIDSDEFLNKQDNPLFWTADGESIGGGFRLLKKLDDDEVSAADSSTLCKRRGRRLSRNSSCAGGSDAPEESLSGRSLSNVVVAEHQRWRPVSRGRYPNHEFCSQIQHSEDGGSYISISEAEEKRILPDMDSKSTRRRSDCQAAANKITNTILADIENPDSMGFMDVRSEYSKLLEESQDRARKLRAELAVEEQHGIELTKILKQIITEPKTPNLKKSHAGHKGSIERRKISKCLEEEAMAYFDECVSISTFDGSDVSSFEDPPCSMVGANGPRSEGLKLQEGSTCKSSISCSAQNQDSVQLQPNLFMEGGSCDGYAFAAEDPSGRSAVNGSSTRCCSKQQFSSTQSLPDASTFEQDIRNLGKLFPKEYWKAGDSCHIAASGRVDMDEYSSKVLVEQFLFDSVTFKNRIESGSLLLCGGGACSLFSPYASGC